MNEKKRNGKMNRFNISRAGIFNSGVERKKERKKKKEERKRGKGSGLER